MSRSTRATKVLEDSSVTFTLHTYEYDPNADRVGIQAAEALGESPDRVLKTLMALVDRKPVCVIVPSDREVSMKKLAAALGGKSAEMMKPAEAERVTGYKVGGISPFGQMRKVPTAIEGFLSHLLGGCGKKTGCQSSCPAKSHTSESPPPAPRSTCP